MSALQRPLELLGRLPCTSARSSLNSLPLKHQEGFIFCLIFQAIGGCTFKKKINVRMQLCRIPFDSCNINTFFF